MKLNHIKRKFICLAWRECVSCAGFKMFKLHLVRQKLCLSNTDGSAK